ncbi:hypothetical protein BJF85_02815 [Saccharomonospora sp. CUA-673]|nr:hypothetical protein BJF85_02815 [Saccharomonospora sp. CUA-673]
MMGVASGAAVGSFIAEANASGNGGGYRFDPEEIDNVIRQWEQLRDDLEKDLIQVEKVANVDKPAEEPASTMFVGSAGQSGQALLEQTNAMINHCNEYIKALKNAKGVTEATDEQAADDARQSGNGML